MYDSKTLKIYILALCHHSFNILLKIELNELEKDRNGDLLLKEKVDFICTKLELVPELVDPGG